MGLGVTHVARGTLRSPGDPQEHRPKESLIVKTLRAKQFYSIQAAPCHGVFMDVSESVGFL